MPYYQPNKIVVLFFLCFQLIIAQKQPSKNYTSANSLPNNTVGSLCIDSDGSLWIGTENGVVKKENNGFRYFFQEDGLAMNNTWAIKEDRFKKMWFGSYGGGVSVYNGAHFKTLTEKEGLVHNEVLKLYQFKNFIAVGTSNGVSLIDLKSYKILSKQPLKEELARVNGFFEFDENLYCSTYNTGVFKITHKNGVLALQKVNNYSSIYSLQETKDSLYISNKGFYQKFAKNEFVTTNNWKQAPKLGSSIIWDYVKTDENRLFAGAWGMFANDGGIFEIKGNKFINLSEKYNIKSDKIISLAYDSNFKKLYLGTRDEGLFVVNLQTKIVFKEKLKNAVLGFAHTTVSKATLFKTGIEIEPKNNNNLTFVSLIQLKKWQTAYVNSTKIPLPKYEDKFYELNYNTNAKNIGFYDIKSFQEKYWINTNIGLFVIQENGELDRYIPVHTEEINFTSNGKLIETNPYHGLRIYHNLDTFKYTYYPEEDANTPTFVVNSFRKNKKTYFVSVFKGLFVLENEKFTSFLDSGIWTENKLRHITSFENNLAIASEFGDVFLINDDEDFKIINKIPRSKIQGNSILFLKEHDGCLLIGTEKGLSLYKDDCVLFVDEEQGLHQPFLSAQTNGSFLEIGSENGSFEINLNQLKQTKQLLNQLNLTGVFINNNAENLENKCQKGVLKLNHQQNTITLQFSTNSHPYPKKLIYQYRLKNDGDWISGGNNPEIFLPYLPSGNYPIAVKVLDLSTGKYFEKEFIQLEIKPAFWETWWFYVLVIGFILFLIFALYRYQLAQNKEFEAQKRAIEKRVEATKLEALLAQMNPHFIFNAMNSIQSYIIHSDIEKASLFLGNFSKLIRNNLDYCTRPSILLVEELAYLESYITVETTRFKNGIASTFEVAQEIDQYQVSIPPMLIQPFIENVFAHAFPPSIENPSLKISFELLGTSQLVCKVIDNGIGSNKSTSSKIRHKSKGVLLVKERLKLLGYQEDVLQISFTPKGTKVQLTLNIIR